MNYKVQFKLKTGLEWYDIMEQGEAFVYLDLQDAVLRAASQAAEFHSYKYRVVEFKEPEVIITLQGGACEFI